MQRRISYNPLNHRLTLSNPLPLSNPLTLSKGPPLPLDCLRTHFNQEDKYIYANDHKYRRDIHFDYFRKMEMRPLFNRKILLLLTFTTVVTHAFSQINIKIGYNLTFPDFKVSDQLLSDFSPEDGEIRKSFGDLNFVHGIQLGLRYQISDMAVELGWENMSRTRNALIYRAPIDAFMDREYNFSLSSISFGVDNYFDRFGIGTTLLYQKMGVSRLIGSNDLNLVAQRELALRLQFILQVQESSLVSLMIKPYYQFNLKGYDLTPLANDLGLSGISRLEESPSMFGLSLVFYNGRQ